MNNRIDPQQSPAHETHPNSRVPSPTVSPAASACAAPPAVTTRRRRGKIARLPAELRDELNARLEDGIPYATIIDWLTAEGHPGINQQNLTNWKQGGFQDWCREQDRMDRQAIQQEWLAEQIAKTQPSELLILIDQLFASQVLDGLFGLDLTDFKKGIAANPRHYIALLNAYNRFKRQMMDIPTFQHYLRCERQSKGRQTVAAPEDLRHLAARLRLLPDDPGLASLRQRVVHQGQSRSVKVNQG